MDNVSDNIKKFRKAKKLSQAKLAEVLKTKFDTDIAQNTISQYENGTREPSLDMLLKIAEALDVSMSDLIDRPKDFSNLSDDDRKILRGREEESQKRKNENDNIDKLRKIYSDIGLNMTEADALKDTYRSLLFQNLLKYMYNYQANKNKMDFYVKNKDNQKALEIRNEINRLTFDIISDIINNTSD